MQKAVLALLLVACCFSQAAAQNNTNSSNATYTESPANPPIFSSGGGGGGGLALSAIIFGSGSVSPNIAVSLKVSKDSNDGVMFPAGAFDKAVQVSVFSVSLSSLGISLGGGAKARSKVLGLLIPARILKAITIVLDLAASRRRQNTEMQLHYLDKIEGTWKPVCSGSPPVTEKNTAKQDLPPEVVNSAGFNPTTGCKNSTLCTGKGGLLVFLDVPAGACSTGSSGGARECDAGCIVGAVLGSVFGAALLAILAFVIWKNQPKGSAAPAAAPKEEHKSDIVYSNPKSASPPPVAPVTSVPLPYPYPYPSFLQPQPMGVPMAPMASVGSPLPFGAPMPYGGVTSVPITVSQFPYSAPYTGSPPMSYGSATKP